jgi:hypothetical protein
MEQWDTRRDQQWAGRAKSDQEHTKAAMPCVSDNVFSSLLVQQAASHGHPKVRMYVKMASLRLKCHITRHVHTDL